MKKLTFELKCIRGMWPLNGAQWFCNLSITFQLRCHRELTHPSSLVCIKFKYHIYYCIAIFYTYSSVTLQCIMCNCLSLVKHNGFNEYFSISISIMYNEQCSIKAKWKFKKHLNLYLILRQLVCYITNTIHLVYDWIAARKMLCYVFD